MILFSKKEEVFHTFIKNNLNNDKKLINKIEEIFQIQKYDILQKTYFLYFLIFFTSNYKNLKIVINRIEKIKKNQYLNIEDPLLLQKLFKTTSLENLTEDNTIKTKILKYLPQIQHILNEKVTNFINLTKKNFDILWNTLKEDTILAKNFIHSNEIIDEKLKENALRWEYFILRKSEEHRKKIRNYFLAKQKECLK